LADNHKTPDEEQFSPAKAEQPQPKEAQHDNTEAEQPLGAADVPSEQDTPQPISEQEMNLLVALKAAREEAEKNRDRWQRALAEFDNYKRRVERERVEAHENAVVEVIKSILPIIDDFERSAENVPEALEGNAWVDGTVAIGRNLKKLLDTHNIEILDPVGQPFDPDQHQGLGVDEGTDIESGHVSVTLQKGYAKGGKLLRPALVRVAD
jgi:molecular chaperone GrpE